jgi:hypothetical protein
MLDYCTEIDATALTVSLLSHRRTIVWIDLLPGEHPAGLIGVHGGMSSSECRVPLIFAGTDRA